MLNLPLLTSFDHLVGEREQPIRRVEAKRVLQGVKTVIIDENGKAVAPS
jgi:hemin uptake protein HemP